MLANKLKTFFFERGFSEVGLRVERAPRRKLHLPRHLEGMDITWMNALRPDKSYFYSEPTGRNNQVKFIALMMQHNMNLIQQDYIQQLGYDPGSVQFEYKTLLSMYNAKKLNNKLIRRVTRDYGPVIIIEYPPKEDTDVGCRRDVYIDGFLVLSYTELHYQYIGIIQTPPSS